MRENVARGLARADGVILMGDDRHTIAARLGGRIPLVRARLAPGPEGAMLRGQQVVAFAGRSAIPERFFRHSLNDVGARVMARHPFDDHYVFQSADIQPILDEAFALNALPVTTAKDAGTPVARSSASR